jgi:hypothetical protein
MTDRFEDLSNGEPQGWSKAVVDKYRSGEYGS